MAPAQAARQLTVERTIARLAAAVEIAHERAVDLDRVHGNRLR
jgi:hypothetical protein